MSPVISAIWTEAFWLHPQITSPDCSLLSRRREALGCSLLVLNSVGFSPCNKMLVQLQGKDIEDEHTITLSISQAGQPSFVSCLTVVEETVFLNDGQQQQHGNQYETFIIMTSPLGST